MDPKEKLLAEMATLEGKMEAFLAKEEKSDEDRQAYEADKKAFQAAESKYKQLVKDDEERAWLKARQEFNDERRKAAVANQPKQSEPKRDPASGTSAIKQGPAEWESDPKKGFKSPREFVQAVMDAGLRGGRSEDDRIKHLQRAATAGSDEHGTYSEAYGGILVPEGFSPNMLRLDPEMDPMGSYVRRVPMATTSVSFPARVDKDHSTSVSGGLTVTRRAETQATSSSRMSMEGVKLTAYSLFGFSYVTEELLTDSPVSFAALLSAGFADEFNSHIIDERLNGTGVGEFQGVIEAPCTVSVAKDSGQAADTITYSNIINMRARCWKYGMAVWLANHDVLPQLMLLNQQVGTGGMPVWQPSAREDHPDMLLGRPLIFTEYCKTLGDKGDIVLGNWMEYLEGLYQPLQSAESMHVRFVEHERVFKFWLRNAGAPWWKSALTPKNSTNTLSPFVVLATR